MDQLEVMRKLKNNKSRDYEGYLNKIVKKNANEEIFTANVQKIKFMNFANINTLPKKGSRIF